MYKLWFDTAMLAAESQHVIALRMMKMACGGPAAQAEAHRMVAEKVSAAMEAMGAIAGGAAPGTIVNGYRRRVGANVRRLTAR